MYPALALDATITNIYIYKQKIQLLFMHMNDLKQTCSEPLVYKLNWISHGMISTEAKSVPTPLNGLTFQSELF